MDCPSCTAAVPPEEIRAARLLARCPSCDVTIQLADENGELSAVDYREPPPPSGIRVHAEEIPARANSGYRNAIHNAGHFRATRRWFTPIIIFMTIFAVAWDSFLVFWYSMAFTGGGPIIMFIFPLVHVAAGVAITLVVIAGWFNGTTIEVKDGEASCVHGPIPVPFVRSQRLRLEEIELFVVGQKSSLGKGKQSVARWNVEARLRSGNKVNFVSQLSTEEQARFLQRKLERFL